MKNIGTITIVLIIVVAAGFYLHWVNQNDAALMKAGDAYTACVQAKFGMNPAGYYQIHGVYPNCP